MGEDGPDIADVAALQADNARLREQLTRILHDLRDRSDVDVQVDLDAPPGSATVRVAPAVRTPLDADGLAEVRQVAERLALVQRDLHRVEQQVAKLLWRVGEPAPPLAAVD